MRISNREVRVSDIAQIRIGSGIVRVIDIQVSSIILSESVSSWSNILERVSFANGRVAGRTISVMPQLAIRPTMSDLWFVASAIGQSTNG